MRNSGFVIAVRVASRDVPVDLFSGALSSLAAGAVLHRGRGLRGLLIAESRRSDCAGRFRLPRLRRGRSSVSRDGTVGSLARATAGAKPTASALPSAPLQTRGRARPRPVASSAMARSVESGLPLLRRSRREPAATNVARSMASIVASANASSLTTAEHDLARAYRGLGTAIRVWLRSRRAGVPSRPAVPRAGWMGL